VKFQAFGEDSGGLDGVLVGHLEEVELVQRLVGGLAGVLWSWRAGVGEGSVEKSVVGELRGQDKDEQVVRRGHGEVGQDDDDGGGHVVQQRDAEGGCREGVCRTRRGRGWAPVQEGIAQSAPPCSPTPLQSSSPHKPAASGPLPPAEVSSGVVAGFQQDLASKPQGATLRGQVLVSRMVLGSSSHTMLPFLAAMVTVAHFFLLVFHCHAPDPPPPGACQQHAGCKVGRRPSSTWSGGEGKGAGGR